MTPDPEPAAVQRYPGVVIVSGPALRAAADAILIAIRSRRLSGLPRSRVHDDLAAAFLDASATGHTDVPDIPLPASLPTVPIVEAAQRMDRSPRQIRRLAKKLGGKKIAGRWYLDEHAITEHLGGRTDGTH